MGLGLGLGLDSLSHSSSHALPFFSPPSFHTLVFPPCSLVCGGQTGPHKTEEKRWDNLTDWMTFEVRKRDTTVSSVWTNSVRNTFRKQAAWAKLQEARTAAAKHWTINSTLSQNVCGIDTTNAGCRRPRKEPRQQRVEASKMTKSGARNALKI